MLTQSPPPPNGFQVIWKEKQREQMKNAFAIWRDSGPYSNLMQGISLNRVYPQGKNAAAYFHWSICEDHHDIEIQTNDTNMIQKDNKDNNITILLGIPVNANKTVTENRPDIVVKDSVNSTYKLLANHIGWLFQQIETKERQVRRPRTRNTENVAYEYRSIPCGCLCSWLNKEGDGRKHQESIRSSYYERD